MPVTRKIMRTRNSERPTVHYSSDAPRRFTEQGTPCVVTLGAYSETGEHDVFSFRVVALKAVEILDECVEGTGKLGYGGVATVGPRGKFWVKVESGVVNGGGNTTAVD